MAEPNDRPVAVIGSGVWGMAAVINVLTDIAVSHPASARSVNLWILNTKQPQPAPYEPYPTHGIAVDDLHPWNTVRPPADFPTLGVYVRHMSKEDPTLLSALDAPTYGQVTAYMDFMMELAIIAAGEKVDMTPLRGVDRVVQEVVDRPATIYFKDGRAVEVSPVFASQPPYLGGDERRGSVY